MSQLFTEIQLDRDQLNQLREIKIERIKLLAQKQEQILNYGLKYYDPHPKQAAFHRAGKFKRRAVFAGNRFGKSDCGAAENSAQAIGHRPWIAKTDPAYTIGIPQRPQKILVITTDWSKVDSVFTNQRGSDTGKMWKFLPRGFVKSTKTNHGSGAIEMMECENGSTINFRTVESFKKNPQSAESDKWDVIHVDEPCPEKMYSAHSRGLIDTDGQAYFTLTPLREPWIFDMFFGEEDHREMVTKGAAHVHRFSNWSVTGSIWDNPYLSESAIVRYLTEDCPEEERECREHGVPLQFAGLIYKEFDKAVHVLNSLPDGWDDFDCPPSKWPVYFQLDPHPQTPCAGLLTTVGPSGRKYTFEEIWLRGIAESIMEDALKKIDGRPLINPQCDPSAFNEDELTHTCWATDFGLAGVWFNKASKELQRGIMAVKAMLRSRMLDGSPSWMFSPYLKRFFYEIKRWHWDKENKPVDKDDHTLECFYRSVLMNPVWIEPDENESNSIDDNEAITGLDSDERWYKHSNLDD